MYRAYGMRQTVRPGGVQIHCFFQAGAIGDTPQQRDTNAADDDKGADAERSR